MTATLVSSQEVSMERRVMWDDTACRGFGIRFQIMPLLTELGKHRLAFYKDVTPTALRERRSRKEAPAAIMTLWDEFSPALPGQCALIGTGRHFLGCLAGEFFVGGGAVRVDQNAAGAIRAAVVSLGV